MFFSHFCQFHGKHTTAKRRFSCVTLATGQHRRRTPEEGTLRVPKSVENLTLLATLQAATDPVPYESPSRPPVLLNGPSRSTQAKRESAGTAAILALEGQQVPTVTLTPARRHQRERNHSASRETAGSFPPDSRSFEKPTDYPRSYVLRTHAAILPVSSALTAI